MNVITEQNEAEAGTEDIWRYMDLTRFVSLLASKSLWFAKAALFHDDPYEGFCRVDPGPIPSDEHGTGLLDRKKLKGQPVEISWGRFRAGVSHMGAEYLNNAGEYLYVNSWCRASESIAMWHLYGASGAGVAVRSSVRRYRHALKHELKEWQYGFGIVQYHEDIASCEELFFELFRDPIPLPGAAIAEKILNLAMHKRSCFEYSKEWRAALYQDRRPGIAGCTIPCDLDELISAVYVGPRADGFVREVVGSVMEKFGLDKPLLESALLKFPSYSDAGSKPRAAEMSSQEQKRK